MGSKPRARNLIEAYLSSIREVYENAGATFAFHPGAGDASIDEYKRCVGRSPSADLIALWQAADGTDSPMLCRPGFLTGYDLLGVGESQTSRTAMEERAPRYGNYAEPRPRDRRIKTGWYQPGWLPFASFGGSTLVLLEDHSPSKEGSIGQIIGFVHDPDSMVYVASSLPELLKRALPQIQRAPYEHGIE